GAGGVSHDRERGIRCPLSRQHAAIDDEEVVYRERAAIRVDDPAAFICRHSRTTDEVGVASEGEGFLRAGGGEDTLHHLLRGGKKLPIVLALRIGEVGDGEPRSEERRVGKERRREQT